MLEINHLSVMGDDLVHYIYQLTSPSGKHYIGQTNQGINKRFSQHVTGWKRWIKDGRPRKSYQTKLFYAFDSYDPMLWVVTQLYETDDTKVCNHKEKELISLYNTVNNGYNTQNGGQEGWTGLPLAEEHRTKISEAKKASYETEEGKVLKERLAARSRAASGEKHPMYGKPAWNRGVARDPEWSRKAAETQQEWWNSEEGMKRKSVMSEQGKLVGANNRGRKLTPEQSLAKSERQKGHVQPQSQKDAVSEKVSKIFVVTHPDGNTEVVKGLRRFCLPRGLSDANIRSKSGSKGYRARLATPEEVAIYQVSAA